MSRRSTRSSISKAKVNLKVFYKDSSSSENSEDLDCLTTSYMQDQHRSKKKFTKRNSRKKCPANIGDCDCSYCSGRMKKRKTTARKSLPSSKGKQTLSKAKGKQRTSLSASAASSCIDLESDDEVGGTNISEIQIDSVKSKVDSFFNALGSSDDELYSKYTGNSDKVSCSQGNKNRKEFYTILSDSEDEKQKPSTSAKTTNFSESNLSGQKFNSSVNSKPGTITSGKKAEDLFTFVDDLLNECNIDLMKEVKGSTVESLEDLKKKTDEILGGVTSFIESYNTKPKESEKKASPPKISPCPICLEAFDESKPAMVTLCGHIFCGPCIAQVAKSTKKCPNCRKSVTKTKYHPVYI